MICRTLEPTMKTPLLALFVGLALTSVNAAAQERAATDTTSTGTSAVALPTPQPAAGFVQPKTPWGDPDLQGFWPGVEMVGVPLQRPAKFGTRNVLTEAEFEQRGRDIKTEEESLLAEIDVFTADVTTPCAIRCPTSPTPHWQETGKPSRQASLIVDPLDGRQPPLSQEGQARQARLQEDNKARLARLQGREADSYLDRSLYDRCITRGVMGSLLPTIYNNGNEIVQGPGYVVIRNEMIHEARVVPLDGRPHVAANVTSYMGDSRGQRDDGYRWERRRAHQRPAHDHRALHAARQGHPAVHGDDRRSRHVDAPLDAVVSVEARAGLRDVRVRVP
jgi:hypothetical protein